MHRPVSPFGTKGDTVLLKASETALTGDASPQTMPTEPDVSRSCVCQMAGKSRYIDIKTDEA